MNHSRLTPRAAGRLGLAALLVGTAALLAAAAAAPPAGESQGSDGAKAPALSPGARQAVYPKSPQAMEALAKSNPLEVLRTALAWSDERVTDYTCRFLKIENIGGELRKPETMQMKFRTKPFGVYVKWIADPSKGQEALYVEGANDGKVAAHPSGILGLLIHRYNIDPNSKLALRHSRRPITFAGMGNMLRLVIPQCEKARANGDLTLTYEGLRQEAGRPTYVFKRVLPKKNDYPCNVLIICIDQEFLLCVRTDAYDWSGELLSHYAYTEIDLNPGLPDKDFDPDNREYSFRLF